jgi:hypothetical protein
MKFKLDQMVWYMVNNKVGSAPVTARMQVENLHEDWAKTDGQWRPFGLGGTYYKTVHGIYREEEVFADKLELLDSL